MSRKKKRKKKGPSIGPNQSRTMRLNKARGMMAGSANHLLVQLYRKIYQLSPVAAMKELKELGIVFTPAEIAVIQAQHQQIEASRAANNKHRKMKAKPADDEDYGMEFGSDETFAFIAGFTSGGEPYGTTWEEAWADEARESGEGSDMEIEGYEWCEADEEAMRETDAYQSDLPF